MAEPANTGYVQDGEAAARTARAVRHVQRESRENYNAAITPLIRPRESGMDTVVWPVQVDGELLDGLHDGHILFVDTTSSSPTWGSAPDGGSLLPIKIIPFPGAMLEIGDMGNARLVGETNESDVSLRKAIYALIGDTTGSGSGGGGGGPPGGSGGGSGGGGLVCSGYVGSWPTTYMTPCIANARQVYTQIVALYLIDGCLQLYKSAATVTDECCVSCGSGSGSGSGSGGGTDTCDQCPGGTADSFTFDTTGLFTGVWAPLAGVWTLAGTGGCVWTTGDDTPSWTLTYDADTGFWTLTGRVEIAGTVQYLVYQSGSFDELGNFDCCSGGSFELQFVSVGGLIGSYEGTVTLAGTGTGCSPDVPTDCGDVGHTLYVTFHDCTGCAACLNGLTFELTYGIVPGGWTAADGTRFCVLNLLLECVSAAEPTWALTNYEGCTWDITGVPTSTTPFLLEISGTASDATSHVGATITETHP